jgi:hypothetical protein
VTISNGTAFHQLAEGDLIVQIISNTDWSGIYGNSSGSTTIDGHGHQDILIRGAWVNNENFFSVSFHKKTQNGILTMNVIDDVTEKVLGLTNTYEVTA